jgi:Helix-turn-helix of DDE superfamily endonuclease
VGDDSGTRLLHVRRVRYQPDPPPVAAGPFPLARTGLRLVRAVFYAVSRAWQPCLAPGYGGFCGDLEDPGSGLRQALLIVAHVRKGETFAELAAGFEVGVPTARRYVNETVALLAARAPKLSQAVRDAKKAGYAYVDLDGTLSSRSTGSPRTARSTPASTGTG